MINEKPLAQGRADSEKFLGISRAELVNRNSLHTAQEISQQPNVWRETYADIHHHRQKIKSWLFKHLQVPGAQVYFCGAGTSAFIGETIAMWLQSGFESTNSIDFRAVSTTDVVASPDAFLRDDRPTIMVSFARSGDSPESVAATRLADQMLSDVHHLVITCNPSGQLAGFAASNDRARCLVMPVGTNDRGFAMTSSYSSMLVACAALFKPDDLQFEAAVKAAEALLQDRIAEISKLAAATHSRLVVLGSGTLSGTAREAALKCAELAAGKLIAISDTSLGFRHGPKIVVTADTLVIQMISSNHYTGRYDRDLLLELRNDDTAKDVVELSAGSLMLDHGQDLDDLWLSLIFIVYCQILAFRKSYHLGIAVDSPCPGGEVNRIVQGVKIYGYS